MAKKLLTIISIVSISSSLYSCFRYNDDSLYNSTDTFFLATIYPPSYGKLGEPSEIGLLIKPEFIGDEDKYKLVYSLKEGSGNLFIKNRQGDQTKVKPLDSTEIDLYTDFYFIPDYTEDALLDFSVIKNNSYQRSTELVLEIH